MNNKHKHYEIGVAKLANTTLVKFVKLPSEWAITTAGEWNITSEYFLCLPQHAEACLHWLNGGFIEVDGDDYHKNNHTMMLNAMTDGAFVLPATIRIKPRKEKRWIAFNKENGNVYGTFCNVGACKQHHPEHQAVEIEVETND